MFIAVLVAALLMSSASSQQPTASAQAHLANAEITNGWITDANGDKLRTFITRPKGVTGKVPAIFFVGWLSCDSMEYADGETDGFGALILRLITSQAMRPYAWTSPG